MAQGADIFTGRLVSLLFYGLAHHVHNNKY
jgi:hypothetical protein